MKNGKNIRGALSYNEKKVAQGKAELILASRYGCEAQDLSFSQKLKRFTLLNEKCTTSRFNTVHISLNFSVLDAVDTEKMQLIAREYMQALGFEKQPYLVYRHNDTAHPHLHIVTTPVRASGSTIYLHNLVQRKSEPARKSIEQSFGLVQAEGRGQAAGLTLVDRKVVQFGKAETKQAISQVVRHVADNWKFGSFEEYNLALQQYGVMADRGEANSRMQKHGGLQYFIVDAQGKQISVAIKASSIYTSPTLKNITAKFARNAVKKVATAKYTASAARFQLSRSNSQQQFVAALQEKKIHTVQQAGRWLFIDKRNKTIHAAQDLGISPEAIQALQQRPHMDYSIDLRLLQKLLEPDYTGPELAGAFLKKKRKKKR